MAIFFLYGNKNVPSAEILRGWRCLRTRTFILFGLSLLVCFYFQLLLTILLISCFYFQLLLTILLIFYFQLLLTILLIFLFLFSAAPYDIAINPVQVDVIVGSAFSAKCTAKGDPAPTFSWYFGDRMIQTGPDLSITASTSTDDGLYTCVATNTLGMQQATMDANVRCTY
jgi:hypothetical protein